MILNEQEFLKFRKIALSSQDSKMFLGSGRFGFVFKYNSESAIKIFRTALSSTNSHFCDYEGTKFINPPIELSTETPNLVLPKESIMFNETNVGYIMDFISGDNLDDLYHQTKLEYYQNFTKNLKKIDYIMKNQVLANNIYYADFKLGNTMISEDVYLIDFDGSIIINNQNQLISKYNSSIITSFINNLYKSDCDYHMKKQAHQDSVIDSGIDNNIIEALNDPFRLTDYWKDHFITDKMDQIDEFVKTYAKKIVK